MNKSITQATQNDKQISKSIKRFFVRFHVSSALKASNAYKKKGVPVVRRHIVGGTYRTLISVQNPLRLCRTGICRSLSAG